MTTFQPISAASDRIMARLIAGLEVEFGPGAGEGLARKYLAAEEAEFRWDARLEERWIGAYESDDEDESWLDRVAIYGRLDGLWFAAIMIIDGEGGARGVLGCRHLGTRNAARAVMMKTN